MALLNDLGATVGAALRGRPRFNRVRQTRAVVFESRAQSRAATEGRPYSSLNGCGKFRRRVAENAAHESQEREFPKFFKRHGRCTSGP